MGSGIFVVTGIAAGVAGPALIVSILIAAAVSLLTALSLIDLSRSVAREGGIYAYAYAYISPYAGFLAGWMYMLGNILGGGSGGAGICVLLQRPGPGHRPEAGDRGRHSRSSPWSTTSGPRTRPGSTT